MSVYFITCREVGMVKIGCAYNPLRRLNTLQCACPLPLEIEAVIAGSYEEERALHAKFAEHRVRGEWFKISPEIEGIIYGNPAPDTKNVRHFIARVRKAQRRGNAPPYQCTRDAERYARAMAEMHATEQLERLA